MQENTYIREIADQFREWERKKSPYLWQRRIEVALPHLPPSGRVLDVGCGDRTAIERFSAQRPDLEFVGADLRDVDPGSGIVRADSQALPFADRSFDGVLMLAVIEHVPDQRAALHEVRRILTDGGVLLVTTPNPLYGLPTAIAGRLGLKYKEGFDNGVSLDRLAALAGDVGLTVEECRGFLILPFDNPLGPIEGWMGGHPLARRLLLNQLLRAKKTS
jgi:SAM-dependent methyltransferase